KVVKTYNRIQAIFPGDTLPAVVVVRAGDVTSPQVAQAIRTLRERAAASPLFRQPIVVKVNGARTVAEVDIPVIGDGNNSASYRALAELRNTLLPATVERVADTSADVTGQTASSKDFNDTMKSRAPIVFVFVLLAAF